MAVSDEQYQSDMSTAELVQLQPVVLLQIKAYRPGKLAQLSRRHKTVNRIYGGHLDHKVVRERIIRAFLIEEQKIVKKV